MRGNSAVAALFILLAFVALFFGVLLAESWFWTGLLALVFAGVFMAFILPRI
ncbi:MAG: hypothetical protein AAB229_05785 [Candidatus Hydrogenedentota bacterium]